MILSEEFVQLRNENGFLQYVPTIKKAFEEAEKDPGIWKISWTDATSGERVRLVKGTLKCEGGVDVTLWYYEPIDVDVNGNEQNEPFVDGLPEAREFNPTFHSG